MAFRLEDRHLVMLAERFPKNWDLTVLGEVVLGLKDYEVDAIKTNHSGDVKQAAHELLKKWNGRQSDPGDAYHLLKTRLRSVQDFTSLATYLEQWVEGDMDQPGTSMCGQTDSGDAYHQLTKRPRCVQDFTSRATCDISDIQQTVRDYLEVELEDSLYNDWLKCDDRKALPLMDLYTDLKWTIKVKKRVGSDQWEERSSVFDILPGQQDKPMKILVEAAAGMGKTSTVSYLAMNWVQHNEKIPFDLVFQVPLRVLNQLDADTSLAEIIQSNNGLEDVSSSRVEAILRGDTKSKVLLILDGYDEYNGKITALNEVVEKNVNSFFLLITSRPGKDPSDETYIKKAVRDKMQRQVMIEGFTDDSIEKCCKLFLDDNEKLKEAMLEQVRQKSAMGTSGYSGLWELLRTPITLLMMCALFEQHGTLPKTRTQIYKQIRELSVERTLNKPGSPLINRQNLEQTLYRLGEFAWKALQEDNLLLSKRELQEKDGDILRLGLLHEVGGDSMSLRKKEIFVSFQHKTMQEFIAAEYVAECVDQSSDKNGKIYQFFQDPCENTYSLNVEVATFCAGLIEDKKLFVGYIIYSCVVTYVKRTIGPFCDQALLESVGLESGIEGLYIDAVKRVLNQSGTLDLSNNKLTGLVQKLLPPDGAPLKNLEMIIFFQSSLKAKDILHLLSLLKAKKLPALTELDLSYNNLSRLLPEITLDSSLSSLKCLSLQGTELTKLDTEHLGELMQQNKLPALKRLYLSSNTLTGILSELRLDSPHQSLQVLYLVKTGLEKSDIQHLARVAQSNRLLNLKELNLSCNNLAGLLPEFKLHSPLLSLQNLNLEATHLNKLDIQQLSCLIRNRKLLSLTDLNLSSNTLTGLLPELRLESPFQSLEVLDLGGTQLNKTDVQHLACQVREEKLSSLDKLDLALNKLCVIEDTCGELIEACVTHHQVFLVLGLWGNNFSKKFIDNWIRRCEGTNVCLNL